MVQEVLQRRLAAIVAIDMVGYSRLVQLDEAGTLARQKAIRTDLIDPAVRSFGGRIVKTTGDGALLEFASVVSAVEWAVAVQREMPDLEVDTPEDRRIAYRIGINLGEIVHDGDDIFGDGVNIAARLEGCADPGGICISEPVFLNVHGKLDLGFVDLGPQQVKNIQDPITAFAVLPNPEDAGTVVTAHRTRKPNMRFGVFAFALVFLAAGYLAWFWLAPPQPSGDRLLIVPFAAATAGDRQIADAATEDFIASLARLEGLQTVPHAVSLGYKGIAPEPGEIDPETGIRYVLGGTAVRVGDRIELAVDLRDFGDDGAVIWEESAGEAPEELFDLLAGLKQRAIAELVGPLSARERSVLQAPGTKDVSAFLAYAEAERFLASGNFFELEKSLPLYERAIEQDPDFLAAHAGYATVNFIIWSRSYNTIRYTLDALDEAERTVRYILNIDDTHPDALGIQIGIKIEKRQWNAALTEARGAVFLQPDEPRLRYVLGQALLAAGLYDEARTEFTAYEDLSPRLNASELRELAFHRLLLDETDRALALLNRVPLEESDRIDQYILAAAAHARNGDIEIAKRFMDLFLKETVWNNLLWQQGYFGRYSDPAIFALWAEALSAAGMPASPFDFEKGREADRLGHDELVALFSDEYEEIVDTGPFGTPYRQDRPSKGVTVMFFGWMDGQPITSRWVIRDGQYCHRTKAVHVDREECNNVYIDREKSTDAVKYVANVYSFGVFESEFRRRVD